LSEVGEVSTVRGRSALRRRRAARAVKILVGCVLLGLGVGVGEALTRLHVITVSSTDRTLAQEVARRLVVPPGANLLTTDIAQFARQAESCPRTKQARVRRDLPHRLLLTVKPREPLLALRKAGRYLLVDEEGMCLYWVERPSGDLLRVDGIPRVKVAVGDHATGEWFDRARQVAQALLQAPDLGPCRLLVNAKQPRESMLIAGSGTKGIVGMDEGLSRRARLFAEVLAELQARGEKVRLMELRTRDPIWWGYDEPGPGRVGR
jgi:hypothetical protein